MKKTQTQLLVASQDTRKEWLGRFYSGGCISIIIILVISIIGFITSKGLTMFLQNGVNPLDFLTKTNWNPGSVTKTGAPAVGALAMIVTSFLVTLLATLVALPFAVSIALFTTELFPRTGSKVVQPAVEIFSGIPSVVYGFLGLTVLVPWIRHLYGGTGFGILAATLVLFLMVLPTITSITTDSLRAVPTQTKMAALALGADRWQMMSQIVLRAATPGILTALVFGMARAFGEALAVQMVIGNAVFLPHNLVSPTATLTSQLTTQMGNTVMGTIANNALWSLALVLLIMSLLFNLLVKIIGRKGAFHAETKNH